MSGDYSTRSVCVVDNGLFAELAVTLARSFGRVYYVVPWENAYPKSTQIMIGQGLEGVEKVASIFDVIDKVDLFVFPDVYYAPLQEWLVKQGKRVWGSGRGEELELDRIKSKEICERAGVAIGPYDVVTGITKLRKHLQRNKDQFVKVSLTRGDFETFKSETYELSEPHLDELEHKLGARKEIVEFIVEDTIEDAVEIGYDGFTIDGAFPTHAMSGIEIKDKGYVGHFKAYNEMAEPILEVNDKLAGILQSYRYRNFWAAEARVTADGVPWVIDPCARFGSPPSELLMNVYTNLADIMWHGSKGEMVDPIPAGEWGAEVMLISSWANLNWQAIDFPPEIRDSVKIHFPVKLGDRYFITPQGFDLPCIGAVVAFGDTLDQAVKRVKTLAGQVQGYFIDIPLDCFDSAEIEIKKLKKFGFDL